MRVAYAAPTIVCVADRTRYEELATRSDSLLRDTCRHQVPFPQLQHWRIGWSLSDDIACKSERMKGGRHRLA
jgi:hypothetical protein